MHIHMHIHIRTHNRKLTTTYHHMLKYDTYRYIRISGYIYIHTYIPTGAQLPAETLTTAQALVPCTVAVDPIDGMSNYTMAAPVCSRNTEKSTARARRLLLATARRAPIAPFIYVYDIYIYICICISA